ATRARRHALPTFAEPRHAERRVRATPTAMPTPVTARRAELATRKKHPARGARPSADAPLVSSSTGPVAKELAPSSAQLAPNPTASGNAWRSPELHAGDATRAGETPPNAVALVTASIPSNASTNPSLRSAVRVAAMDDRRKARATVKEPAWRV